jgi:glycosyltransferase involved in cell wall biosynthesis
MKCEFRLIGDLDLGNPGTITEKELMQWREEGHIRILGFRSDIAQQYAESHIVCLPSYYGEGLPKSLIEAAACGRAIVTTDMPGCRDAIVPGTTGIIVPPRDAISLANAIQTLIENKEVRKAMGVAGRQLAEKEYAIEKTVDQHMIIYQELLERAV